jgi:hypothetical protein
LYIECYKAFPLTVAAGLRTIQFLFEDRDALKNGEIMNQMLRKLYCSRQNLNCSIFMMILADVFGLNWTQRLMTVQISPCRAS